MAAWSAVMDTHIQMEGNMVVDHNRYMAGLEVLALMNSIPAPQHDHREDSMGSSLGHTKEEDRNQVSPRTCPWAAHLVVANQDALTKLLVLAPWEIVREILPRRPKVLDLASWAS